MMTQIRTDPNFDNDIFSVSAPLFPQLFVQSARQPTGQRFINSDTIAEAQNEKTNKE